MTFGRSGKDDKDISITPTDTSSVLGASASQGNKLEAFLGKGSKIVGNLTFTGPVELDGYVEGEINAQDRITIGESAVVNARIVGGEIIIKGTVNGDVSASKKLSLKKPARILGNISSTNLSIEEGVVFEGKCMMGDSKGANQPKAAANSSSVAAVGGTAPKFGAAV